MTPSKLPPSATDHDRIVRMETMLDEMHTALMGAAGEGGLVRRSAELGAELDSVRDDVKGLRAVVPSPREKQVFTSVTIGMFATLLAIVAQFLGIDIGQVKGQ